MDSVEKKKNEEMGNLGTCFQGNRGLKNTGRLDFFILHAALPSGKILQTPLMTPKHSLLALLLLLKHTAWLQVTQTPPLLSVCVCVCVCV